MRPRGFEPRSSAWKAYPRRLRSYHCPTSFLYSANSVRNPFFLPRVFLSGKKEALRLQAREEYLVEIIINMMNTYTPHPEGCGFPVCSSYRRTNLYYLPLSKVRDLFSLYPTSIIHPITEININRFQARRMHG